jgi:CRISPR-associated protein Csm5
MAEWFGGLTSGFGSEPSMKYRVTVLTPTLVGDGQRLAPIDYMVWKDQVNVLNQGKIFQMLAKGPRLEGYLAQIRKVEKLDFNQWGGYAQSYAQRRIPFESAACTPAWEELPAEDLFIPTFARSGQGHFLPASALKGALRTLFLQQKYSESKMAEVAEKKPRRPGPALDEAIIGSRQNDPFVRLRLGDSGAISADQFRVFQVKVSSFWKRGTEVAPVWKPKSRFAEMATVGTVFEGEFEGGRSTDAALSEARPAGLALLERQLAYGRRAQLKEVTAGLESVLLQARGSSGVVLSLGWGAGLVSKSAIPEPGSGSSRQFMENHPNFENSLRLGLGVPKTRKVVFAQGKPAQLPGIVLFEPSY